MNNKKVNRKPLVEYIQSHSQEIESLIVAKEQYPDRELSLLKVEEWFTQCDDTSVITVDCRSEAEYEESHLPGSINFPILNNKERDEVGFLYKHFSPNAALFHANEIAESKVDEIDAFVKTLSEYKKVIVYCWRGGARSAAFTHFLQQRKLPVQKIIGGYKAFRGVVYKALYEEPEQFKFIILSGLTGSGKTEILEKIIDKAPVFDIEHAALHASSLFGKVRFNNMADTITSQQHFETRLYMQLNRAQKEFPGRPIFTESESRKISDFELPAPLFDWLRKADVVNIDADLSLRAKRTAVEYFYDEGVRVREIVAESSYFKMKLGQKVVDELLELIDSGKYYEFCHWFLEKYYDKNYKSHYPNVIKTVKNKNVDDAIEELVAFCNSY